MLQSSKAISHKNTKERQFFVVDLLLTEEKKDAFCPRAIFEAIHEIWLILPNE
ncbi:hypothetical protein C943_02761 [Mariniradius saccharolyticus AK6]|uniref:Uncharacterized protein n=1 Tax=Mariniradius saccharolyticus AK6 TaxID=1239962 RepID=M7X8D1_9BACT|nr:hypothetical protein C943_02761 [Mariniradius saccharolyticus AK6]